MVECITHLPLTLQVPGLIPSLAKSGRVGSYWPVPNSFQC